MNEEHYQYVLDRCVIDPETGCWVWQRTKRNGYGDLGKWARSRELTRRPHRLSYEAVNGPITEGLLIRHKCDNRPCCNPEHLVVGTHEDNSLDHYLRGVVGPPKFKGREKEYMRYYMRKRLNVKTPRIE